MYTRRKELGTRTFVDAQKAVQLEEGGWREVELARVGGGGSGVFLYKEAVRKSSECPLSKIKKIKSLYTGSERSPKATLHALVRGTCRRRTIFYPLDIHQLLMVCVKTMVA